MKRVEDGVRRNNPYHSQEFQAVEYTRIIFALFSIKYLLYIGRKRKTEKTLEDTTLLLRLWEYRFFVIGIAFLFCFVLQFCSELIVRCINWLLELFLFIVNHALNNTKRRRAYRLPFVLLFSKVRNSFFLRSFARRYTKQSYIVAAIAIATNDSKNPL